MPLNVSCGLSVLQSRFPHYIYYFKCSVFQRIVWSATLRKCPLVFAWSRWIWSFSLCWMTRMWFWWELWETWTFPSLYLRMCLSSWGWSLTCSLGWTALAFATPASMTQWSRPSRTTTTFCSLYRQGLFTLIHIVHENSHCEGLISNRVWWFFFLQVDKVVQMYETMMTRHTTMVVGPTGGGKSVVINTLCQAQTR